MGGVSTLRGPPIGIAQHNANSPQTTPTSSGFPANPVGGGLAPAYFDAAGQPVARNKVSTVGSASATESVGDRTATSTEVGGGDNCTLTDDRDEDMFTEMDSASASGYMGADAMDEDLDNLTSRSVGGYEDRMSDDGSASLVGFGEGAGSTLSGPIYSRRPLPGHGNVSGPAAAVANWHLERSSSGLSEGATGSPNPHHHSGAGARRDIPARMMDRETSGTDTPVSMSAVRERREARMMDGVAVDNAAPATTAASSTAAAVNDDDDVFVDTTTRGPVPVHHPTTNTVRDRQQQPHQHQAAQPQYPTSTSTSTREAAERIVRETLGEGENRVGGTALRSPRGGEPLGKFYFEDR